MLLIALQAFIEEVAHLAVELCQVSWNRIPILVAIPRPNGFDLQFPANLLELQEQQNAHPLELVDICISRHVTLRLHCPGFPQRDARRNQGESGVLSRTPLPVP